MRPAQPILYSRRFVGRTAVSDVGLDHADQSVAVAQRVIDHGKITRFENIEWHLSARQKQCARQRKDRDDCRAIRLVRDIERSSACSLCSAIRRRRRGETFLLRITFPMRYENKIDDRRLRPSIVAGSVATPCFKELDKLLARAIVIPFAVALDDFDQVLDRVFAFVRLH